MLIDTGNDFEPVVGFDYMKSIQLCARFLILAGGQLEKLKLIKLMYLSERESLRLYEEPLLWDEYYSLKHGPICSSTLNCINKRTYSNYSDRFFAIFHGKNVRLVKGVTLDDLDALSDAELQIADAVWHEHRHRTASQIRAYTHEFCREYTHVEHGRAPITYESMLLALGSEHAHEVSEEIAAYRSAVSHYE